MRAEPPPLEVTDLTKRFGSIEALRGVSFVVEPGEVVGYLGPNGAGKTTTLRIALGLVHPTAGEVRLFGQPPANAASRDDIGFIPGDLRLYGDMTGRGVLEYFAGFRPRRPPIRRGEIADALGVDTGVLRQRVKFLSHGTRQKLGLLVAMQHDPAFLLLDEPSNGIDPLVQHAFRALVVEHARRGRAVLLSSHIISEAEAVCSRVAILRAGRVVALESIEALRASVVRRARIGFRGAPPAGLAETPGVTRVEANGADVALWLRGDVNPLLRTLAGADIERLVFPEPELEDIFLDYYRPEGNALA